MCGICGLVGSGARPVLVDGMRAALTHRGPDSGSTDAYNSCVLGHQRLIVIDPEAGYQPVANERGDVVAVFNGELYNFPELRLELHAHDVRGRGDTPVIPHLYEEHGVDFVDRLHGMFALALWDASRERLVLARDRVGKKPLLYARLPDGTFAFASELKALLTLPSLPRELDLDAVDAYLALGYIPGERTALQAVRRVPPGHRLVVERGEARVERWWTLEPLDEHLDEDAWLDRVRAEVGAAVRRRLVADVPLGALLSGGIDSSVIVALMAQASREPVRTFTIGFADERYDERRWARAVADRWGTVHEEVVLDPDLEEALPRLAQVLDEPFGDESVLPTFLVCEEARRHVTVALAGDGGDEAFAGYERYFAHGAAGRLPAGARAVGGALRRLPGQEQRSRATRAARFLELGGLDAAERYGRIMEVFSATSRRALWTHEARSAGELLGPPPAPGIGGLQRLDIATYLPGDLLYKADIASMANSLELRAPFLDHEVLRLGISLPDSLKLRGRRGKLALRRAFADVLPPEIVARGKAGFGVPLARWFREDARALVEELLLDERARSRGLFRPEAVRALLDENAAGRVDHGHRIWTLLALELWQRTHVEAAAPASAAAATA